MKCAYCKQTIPDMRDANEEPKERTYIVEINGVECEIWLHDDCIPKILSEFFSRKPEVMANNHITIDPNDRNKWWTTPQSIPCGGTTDCPPPDTTRVWCKAKVSEDPHSPWRDRVD